jgi:hypothetical protein
VIFFKKVYLLPAYFFKKKFTEKYALFLLIIFSQKILALLSAFFFLTQKNRKKSFYSRFFNLLHFLVNDSFISFCDAIVFVGCRSFQQSKNSPRRRVCNLFGHFLPATELHKHVDIYRVNFIIELMLNFPFFSPYRRHFIRILLPCCVGRSVWPQPYVRPQIETTNAGFSKEKPQEIDVVG